jgi:GNAT superfamily N-acetyltransferase
VEDENPFWDYMLNAILGIGLNAALQESELDEAIAFFQEAWTPFSARINPYGDPGTVIDWLEQRGFFFSGNLCRLARGTDDPPEVWSYLRVEEIGPGYGDAFAWLAGQSQALLPALQALVGRPGWHHFLAFDEDWPVASGSLYAHGNVGWLGWAYTDPEYRGRGAQSLLLAARIHAAHALGLRWVTAETRDEVPDSPNPSLRNMFRLGFWAPYLQPTFVSG